MEACVSMWPSSALLITSAIISSEHFATSFISDIIPSKISSSSNLVVRQWYAECDCKQSSLSFHLERWDILSHSLGGSCPDPPWAVLSGTALPLPLSGGMMLYSSSMLLILGDSCAPASDPPPIGGGFVVASWSAMLLVSSSWDCELMVTPVRFAPDCTPVLLYDGLGRTTFHFAIGCHCCWSNCSAMNYWVACCSNKIIHGVNNLLKELWKSLRVSYECHEISKSTSFGLQQDM